MSVGLGKSQPGLYRLFLAGALCLAGFPLTGGFFSKDSILEAVWSRGGALYGGLFLLGLLTAFLTAEASSLSDGHLAMPDRRLFGLGLLLRHDLLLSAQGRSAPRLRFGALRRAALASLH